MNFSIEWMNEWFELILKSWKWVKIRVFSSGVKMLENRWNSRFLGPPGFDEFHWIFYRFWILWVSMNFFELLNDFFFFWMIFFFWLKNFFLIEWKRSVLCFVLNGCEMMKMNVYEWMKRLYIYIDIYIYMWFFVTHPRMWQFVWYCV